MTGMPGLIRPMLAKLEKHLPAGDDRYGWEFKWDGVRTIVYAADGALRLLSRNDKDMTASYPELATLPGQVPGEMILDGEIVALRDGRPDFAMLQSRMHVRHPAPSLVADAPVQLYLFDLLYHNGDPLLELAYTQRRGRLDDLNLNTGPVRTPSWYHGDAQAVLAASLAHGLEGVVGKPLASRYRPGVRGWIKVKNVRQQEVIICGWTPGHGRRADMIGSLLLGVYQDGALRYAGQVGTGFTQAMLTALTRHLRPLERDDSPFTTPVPARHARDARWVHPRLAGEVTFAEWTADGSMRHPSWRGLRPDKNPRDIHREEHGPDPEG